MPKETIGVFIEPRGPLFFRGGKPLEGGTRVKSDHPNPQVLAGALTTLLLRHFKVDLRKLGEASKYGFRKALEATDPDRAAIADIRFKGPWLAEEGELDPVLTPPANLRTLKAKNGEKKGKAALLMPLSRACEFPGWAGAGGNDKLRPLVPGKEVGWEFEKKPQQPLFRASHISQFAPDSYSREQEKSKEKSPVSFFTRSGIQVKSDSLTVEEGMLFTQEMLELASGWGYYAEVTGESSVLEAIDDHPRPVIFGGDSRVSTVRRVKPVKWPAAGNGPNRFVMLTAPAFFSGGNPALPDLPGLVAAAVTGSFAISGWDLAKRGPKPTRFGVPAGSVYFFEGEIARDLSEAGSLCADEDARIGWGTFIEGSWDYVQL